jgi:lysine 2,3-aminomutase
VRVETGCESQISSYSEGDDPEQPPGLGVLSHSESHKELLEGEFWRAIPAYRQVDEKTFLCHGWQGRNSVTRIEELVSVLDPLVPEAFYRDVAAGLERAPMSLRISPYILSLIDWREPVTDPLRRQFIPLGSEQLPDHPLVGFDSLHEQKDTAVPGLVHRYPDKALFLALNHCPVYCRFCTRSYAVGRRARGAGNGRLCASPSRWKLAFDYIRSHPGIEDVVVSGGDVYNLRAEQIRYIGISLLNIPHVRRVRFGTRGLGVMPMKVLSDDAWFRAFADVVEVGRCLFKQVAIHTHIAHPREVTDITRRAVERLFASGVTVRNQCVLMRGVNDDARVLQLLVKRLGYLNIQPYYVYQHDLVPGVEDLRTSLSTALQLEKQVRGATAGFNTPAFVVDAPGGGGKRIVHSYEYYDPVTGVSVYRSPCVDENAAYLYFDPLHLLPDLGRAQWKDRSAAGSIIARALEEAGCRPRTRRTQRRKAASA